MSTGHLPGSFVEHIFAQPATMQQLIASYLFQHKNCPLPGFGSLSMVTTGAEADFTNHLIGAPRQFIHFSDKEINAANFVNYVAGKTGTSESEVTASLRDFSSGLKNEISANAKAALPGIGDFFVDEHGNTIFEQSALPEAFVQPVTAIRVIHPNAEHTMLVGDKETTNTMMTEYFSEEEAVKDRWWIWVVVLAALALLSLIIYFSNTDNASHLGNAVKI